MFDHTLQIDYQIGMTKMFLSPANRGRGILVAPGLIPSGVRLFVGAKAKKLVGNFLEILKSHHWQHDDVQLIFF